MENNINESFIDDIIRSYDYNSSQRSNDFTDEQINTIQNIAHKLFENKDFKKSKQYYNFLAYIKPNVPDYYFYIGICYMNFCLTDDIIYSANENFLNAFFLDKNNSNIIFNVIHTFMLLKEYRMALRFIEKALKLKSHYVQVHYYKAICLMNFEKYYEAKQHLNFIIKMEPDNKEFYYTRGLVNYALERYNEAKNDFHMAKELICSLEFDKINYEKNINEFLKKIDYKSKYENSYLNNKNTYKWWKWFKFWD